VRSSGSPVLPQEQQDVARPTSRAVVPAWKSEPGELAPLPRSMFEAHLDRLDLEARAWRHVDTSIGVGAGLVDMTTPCGAHCHDFYEIAFAMMGGGQYEDETGRVPVIARDVWIIKPGDWHAYPTIAGDLKIFNLLLMPSILARFASDVDGDDRERVLPIASKSHMSMLASRCIRLPAEVLDHVHELLVSLYEELPAARSNAKTLICIGLVAQILGMLDRHGMREDARSPALAITVDHGILRAVQFIEANYAHHVTLQDLAVQSGYASTYLSRKFKQRLGVPPSDYLLAVRLRRACALLKSTDLPITVIAHNVGFADNRYFSTCFHRAMGMTPRRFRQASS